MPHAFIQSALLETKHEESRFEIVVVFTSIEQTAGALKRASALAGSLDARIALIVPLIVPYPLPLQTPQIPIDFLQKQLRDIAKDSAAETHVHLYLCRDKLTTLKRRLAPHSLVVVGGRKRWWPTAASRLAARLRRAGHDVVFTETE